MELNEYQKEASKTSTYVEDALGVAARFMGLAGEAGEATDKAKKEIRDHADDPFGSRERNEAIIKELGDALWYISQCAAALNFSLEDVARINLAKLADRQRRGTIHGAGDER